LEALLVLLEESVLRLLEDADQRILVERIERDHRREAPDQLRDHPEAQQVLGLDARERVVAVIGLRGSPVEADATLPLPRLDHLVQPIERATADEEDVLRVDLDV